MCTYHPPILVLVRQRVKQSDSTHIKKTVIMSERGLNIKYHPLYDGTRAFAIVMVLVPDHMLCVCVCLQDDWPLKISANKC